MAKYLLLCSVFLVLVLAGSAASADPVATAPPPPLFAADQVASASPPLCEAPAPEGLFDIKPKRMVSSCQGNGCDKTSDCRPPGVPDCAQCWCIGPAGDKSCGCI